MAIVSADPSLSLQELNLLIKQQEELLGPLITVGNDAKLNVLSFDDLRDPPEKHAMIDVGGPPPNSQPLAWGKVFVGGELKDVLAFRPN